MIVLRNQGEIDLDVIKIMGVNVKQSENSIGYFGTGLKFAIATFLRNGIEFEMYRGNDKYEFFAEDKNIRGKGFMQCHMQGPMDRIDLPFTTELGRNWEVWQAYREIHSNCLDENGSIFESDTPEYSEGFTTFVIKSDIDVAGVFLDDSEEPLYESDEIDIYEGQSDCIYYQGIRAKMLRDPSNYTYNIKRECTLTEDRLICYDFSVEEAITKAVSQMENKDIVKNIITSKTGYESSLNPMSNCYEAPSETFIDVLSENKSDVNSSFHGYAKRHEPVKELTREERKEKFISCLEELCAEYDVNIETDCSDQVLTLTEGVLLEAE